MRCGAGRVPVFFFYIILVTLQKLRQSQEPHAHR
jgi:hypothetical protein